MNIMASLPLLCSRHRVMVETESSWWENFIHMMTWVEKIGTSSQVKGYEGNKARQHAIERAWERK